MPLYNSFSTQQHSDLLQNKSDHVITRLKTFPCFLLRIMAVLLTCSLRSFMSWPLLNSLTTFPLVHSALATLAFFQVCNTLLFLTTFAQAVSSALEYCFPRPFCGHSQLSVIASELTTLHVPCPYYCLYPVLCRRLNKNSWRWCHFAKVL